MAVHYLLRRGISGGSPLNPLRGLLLVSQELGRHPLSSAAAGDAVAGLKGARGREDVKQLLKATSCHPILGMYFGDHLLSDLRGPSKAG